MASDTVDLGDLRTHVAALADIVGLTRSGSNKNEAVYTDLKSQRLTTARAWQRANAVAEQAFGNEALFLNPAWDLILELYVSRLEERAASVDLLSQAVKVPRATAQRWIDLFVERGLVKRITEISGLNRTVVSMSDHGIDRVNSALDAAIMSDRRLGLSRMQFSDGM